MSWSDSDTNSSGSSSDSSGSSSDYSAVKTCLALKKNGTKCLQYPVRGKDYCYVHRSYVEVPEEFPDEVPEEFPDEVPEDNPMPLDFILLKVKEVAQMCQHLSLSDKNVVNNVFHIELFHSHENEPMTDSESVTVEDSVENPVHVILSVNSENTIPVIVPSVVETPTSVVSDNVDPTIIVVPQDSPVPGSKRSKRNRRRRENVKSPQVF